MQFFNECKTKAEAKATFRRLSKCFHPDKDGENDLMVELQKQFDNWEKKKPNQNAEPLVNPYQEFSYAYNPRVEMLEKELTKLRKQLENPHRQVDAIRACLTAEERKGQEKEKRILQLKDEVYGLNCSLSQKAKDNEDLFSVMTSTLEEATKLKQEIQLLKEAEKQDPEEIDLTLWQKIKYVIGDKSIKRYN